jgi:DNA polymerase bacteriophage-type
VLAAIRSHPKQPAHRVDAVLQPSPQFANTAAAPTVCVLHRDYETRSRAILKTVGAQCYAADTTTEVLCCCYAADDGPVKLWRPGEPVPTEFLAAAQSQNWVVVAHNDAFETAIEKLILAPRYKWPIIPIERHRCTMAMSLACGLPGRLSKAADALELAHRKDAGGERLMHQTSKPRKAHKDENPNSIYWFDDKERLERLYSYCAQDVEVERELYNRLPPLSEAEQKIWLLNHQINSRGYPIDRAFAEAALKITEQAGPEINADLAEITGGDVTSINQVAKLLAWLQDHGCKLQSLDQGAVERQLAKGNGELAAPVRRALELRRSGAQAATKKITALLARAGADDRIRGGFKYHGAATGRWSGEGVQAQNLKKPDVDDLDAAIAAVATANYAHVKSLYPRPLSVVGDVSRAMICAPDGKKLIGADFSAIESRVLAWVAAEAWKLDSYRRFDATHDPADEPYRVTAAKIFRTQPGNITKDQRNIGKTADLAFGYQGGLGAWRNFQPDQFTDAEVEQFKKEWRAAHPNIKRLWYLLDKAAWTAVKERGRTVRCGVVRFRCDGAFLQLILPSGRKIFYPQPRIIGDEIEQRVVFTDSAAGKFTDCRHGQGAYGGTWTENVVQGIARDLLADAMLRVEAAGYPIVIHVHDEIVAEVPEGRGSEDEFTRLMVCKPSWALDLPIAAKAWTGKRYTKGA